MQTLEPMLHDKIQEWLSPVFDEKTRKEIERLQVENESELTESFYKDLQFGTGGMRGIMGVGTNRINRYTLGKSTQGLSNYLLKNTVANQPKVVIAYDCRNQSDTLAQVVADVFSANGIQVYLFSSLRPTPELSFAVRALSCQCGIVLTASHNPPEYNGYKVYWKDGGQLVPPEDKEIITEISALNYDDIQFNANPNLIQKIDQKIDEQFIAKSVENGSFAASQEAKANVKIVFTSLHGTSITLVPETLKRAGFNQVHIVEEQAEPNGNFPTVKSPNPEEPEALKMALELANKVDADIVIGTDPDCDRLGIAVRDQNNELQLLNGNQAMIVMTWFILLHYKNNNALNNNSFIASTIVSTPLMRKLADSFDVEYMEVLTGFKWIAKLIKDFPSKKFIAGGEESFGFMVGDFVRDKDAVTSTVLICELVAYLKNQGSSVFEQLLNLYNTHGLYKERLISLTKKGMDGAQQIKQMMDNLRTSPPTTIANEKVIKIEDYLTSIAFEPETTKQTGINIPVANVLIFYTDKGSKIAARPSGTEPKIKFYITVKGELNKVSKYEEVTLALEEKINKIQASMNLT